MKVWQLAFVGSISGVVLVACGFSDFGSGLKKATFYQLDQFPSCDGDRNYPADVWPVSPAEGTYIPDYGVLSCEKNQVKLDSADKADIDDADWQLFAMKGIKTGDKEAVLQFVADNDPSLVSKGEDGKWLVSKPGCTAGPKKDKVCGKKFNATLKGPDGTQKVKVVIDSYCPTNHWKNAAKPLFDPPRPEDGYEGTKNPCEPGEHVDIGDTMARKFGVNGSNQGSYTVKLGSEIK